MLSRFNFCSKNTLVLEKPFKFHNDEITDMVEVTYPQPCIITCGLDRRIVFFSLKEERVLRVLPTHHRTSVRSLCFFEEFGNFLLSAGSDQDVYVWAMENQINDPLYGKLRGHKAPVSDLFRFPLQPFAATIDTSGTIKIWDIRKLFCL